MSETLLEAYGLRSTVERYRGTVGGSDAMGNSVTLSRLPFSNACSSQPIIVQMFHGNT